MVRLNGCTIQYLKQHLNKEFPKLLSYNRFVELMPSILIPMCAFIQAQSKTQTGIYFVDATTIDVCHVKRASSNRVFKGIAIPNKLENAMISTIRSCH